MHCSNPRPHLIMDLSSINTEILFKKTRLIAQKGSSTESSSKRIYHPHLFDTNIAAIDAPFCKEIIGDDDLSWFPLKSIEEAVTSFIGDGSNLICSLIRVFCMSDFNYCGNWHKDTDTFDRYFQVAVFTKKQEGFRLLNYEKILLDSPTTKS